MTFSPEQIALLKAPLDRQHVKQRSQAGRSLSYIEGWHAIAEANRIFGFDAWDRELVTIKQLGEPREVDGKWRVAYMATVRVKVRPKTPTDLDWQHIVREGTGYGSGIDKDLGSAHESALKESETDAMKRALMTFGNPFGLALYDKEQRAVVDATAPHKYLMHILNKIVASPDAIALGQLMANPHVTTAMEEMSASEREQIETMKAQRLASFEKEAA